MKRPQIVKSNCSPGFWCEYFFESCELGDSHSFGSQHGAETPNLIRVPHLDEGHGYLCKEPEESQ